MPSVTRVVHADGGSGLLSRENSCDVPSSRA